MAISATIAAADMAAANKALLDQGFGPGSFSVPMRAGTGDATHASLHLGGRDPAFLAALEDLQTTFPALVLDHDDTTTRNIGAHIANTGLEWVWPDPENLPGYAKGAEATVDGVVWVSTIENNVWTPGTAGWHRKDAQWVQPAGALDAYAAGAVVTHNGSEWTSDLDANVWEPGVYGWTESVAATDEWSAGVTYAVGDEVTYQGATYRCITGHTAIVGWQPPAVPALWEPV